ncbi:hypothetical protein CCUS01_14418 [Colletotrichum cuscutae]|uniref:Uncharacterized protein n=1 Tax=Colletotrichum cuscutae TaxID=1209917 RepID=A0AAI9Y911_9PEZI|nr:hypothetical protein CCUS01_14418 [Colletotrichum cuscutae]
MSINICIVVGSLCPPCLDYQLFLRIMSSVYSVDIVCVYCSTVPSWLLFWE